MPEGNERRRNPRFRMDAYAALESKGMFTSNDQAFGPVLDISRTGIRMRTGQPPHVGQMVVLRVAVEEDIHTLRAIAARVTPAGRDLYDVGMDFSWCSTEELAFLDECIELVSRAG